MELDDVLDELEQARGRLLFKSVLNQPTYVSLSSADTVENSVVGFSTFTMNLPRPILEAESLQLVHANIPACTQNIPDTACVFWYYRLSEYSGRTPNPDNLFFVRLLPSYYRTEFIDGVYGQNKTFLNYPELATQLALSCATDLAFVNLRDEDIDEDLREFRLSFLPNEISLPFNASLNKFQMIGTNATTPLVFANYSSGTTYGLGVYVKVGLFSYQSLVAGNIGNFPATSPEWKRVYVDAVETYAVATPYRKGAYVSSGNVLYIALVDNINVPVSDARWSVEVASINYRYLIAGYTDPNVALMQGSTKRTWNRYNLYEDGDVVQYSGRDWVALAQNRGYVPFLQTGATAWTGARFYDVGDLVFVGSIFYIAITPGQGNAPSTFSTFWSQYWWAPAEVSPAYVGLTDLSQDFDMMDNWDGITQYPFPIGIPSQPFNPKPRRLLNSILGFTWNGAMSVEQLSTIETDDLNVSRSSTITELYNRLRPVPQYYRRYTTPGLGSTPTAIVSQTYTADGYANLVYSSICSIYCSIVAASSLNTTTSTDLLATASMNCGNLGIAFYNTSLDTPMHVSGVDIYTVKIELRDEFNEPYVLTNNAVVSLVMKVRYKSSGVV